MRNRTKKYEVKIRGTEYTFTAHSTKVGARGAIHEAYNPCLVQLPDGWFDSFPLGHPLPFDAIVIERCDNGRWRKVA